MADLKLECANCGALFQVSQYIDSDTVSCPQCDNTLEVAKSVVDEKSGLIIRRDKSGSGFGGIPGDEAPVVAAPPPMSKKRRREMERNRRIQKKKERRPEKGDPYERTAPKPWHGWAALLVLSLVLVGLLSGKLGFPEEWYYKVRLVLFPLIYIAVIVAAFGEGYLNGILCILLPPYLFYYAVSRTDVYYIRGAFLAMVIALSCELYYNSERSFLAHVESGINGVIDAGADAINRTGNSGVEFID